MDDDCFASGSVFFGYVYSCFGLGEGASEEACEEIGGLAVGLVCVGVDEGEQEDGEGEEEKS